jgi:hypothetical protein
MNLYVKKYYFEVLVKTSLTMVVYLTSLCVNWAFFDMSGPVYLKVHECHEEPNLHTNELNTSLLKIFKIRLTFRFDKL